MAFPEDPLGLRVEIKAGQWTNITGDVYTRDAITHTRGIRSGGTTAEPASVPLTINNRDGKYSPRNPVGPYYGLIGRNTPVRLSLPGGGHFLDLDGDPASYASTPDVAALDITGSLDLRWEGEANWYGPGATMLIGKWGEAGNRSYHLRIQDGALFLHVSRDGVTGPWAGRPLPALPRRAALRATIDTTTPAGGYTFRHYWAESLAGPWTQISADYSVNDSPVTIYAGTAPLTIAPTELNTSPPRRALEGRVYAAQVRAGIDGTLVAAPDFTQRPVGAGAFIDSAGRTWSFSGSATVADRRELFVGEIASWPQKWVPSGADVWTPVQAAGILRRYGQGAKALDSTLRRRIPSGRPIAYWPMEEDREATRAYSPILGVRPAALTGVEFGALDTLPSSKALPKISAGGTLSAIVPAHADRGEWQVELVYNADDKPPPASDVHHELISVSTTGTVRRWVIGMQNADVRVFGFNSSGEDVIFRSISVNSDVFHGWVRLRLWARDNGAGSVEWRLDFQDVGGDAGGYGSTITGTTGHVTAVTATWTEAMAGWGIGHLSVLPTAANSLYTGSDDGYAGETAWARIQRLALEEAIPVSRIAGPLAPQRVGPQRPETLLSLLQEAADADGGMLVESRDRLGLLYRDRSSLYTQEPALVLDYAAGHIAAGSLEPTDDDDATRNDITVTRTGGSSARSLLEEGPLSVQAPPAGIGLYDESVTLNVNDDVQLEYIAPWRLHLGTYDGARYPAVTIRLHKHPELIDTVLGLREGDILRIVNLPPWVAYGPVDLLITGLSETLLPRTWTVTLPCEPGGPWMTAKADHPVYGKANTDGSMLAGPATAVDTTLAVRTTAGPQWTEDQAELPFDVQVGGEVVTVKAVGRVLSGPATFDPTISGWLVDSSTLDRVTAPLPPKAGATAALAITATGTLWAGGVGPLTAVDAVTAGATYRTGFWAYSPTGTDVRPTVSWYNAAGTFQSSSPAPSVIIPAATWTYVSATVTAPAASRARVRPRFVPASAGEVLYVWAPVLLGPAPVVADTFTRSVTGGWGVADSGQAWTASGGTVATDYDVNGTAARHLATTRNLFRVTALNSVVLVDVEVMLRVAVPFTPTGDGVYVYFLARTDPALASFYFARLYVSTGGVAQLSLRKRTPAETLLATASTTLSHEPGTPYWIRFRVEGSALMARAWKDGSPEPAVWHVEATDSDPLVPASGGVGLRSYISNTNTNALPVTIAYDDFQITDSQTFTVTRSVNGVNKPHAARTALALAHPAIASL
ncbi:hypothetical protein ACYSUO_18705 [Streptomyces sp. UC4497]